MSNQNNKEDGNDALPPCPDCMMCPISCERMVEPVVASDGHTYERAQIQQWFNLHNTTSPKTGETLTFLSLDRKPRFENTNHGMERWTDEGKGRSNATQRAERKHM